MSPESCAVYRLDWASPRTRSAMAPTMARNTTEMGSAMKADAAAVARR